MDRNISLALFSELNFLVRDGWKLVQEPDRFRVQSQPQTIDQIRSTDALRDEAWRIAQFVAYSHFVSIAKNPDGSFTIVSTMDSGDGFEIIVEALN